MKCIKNKIPPKLVAGVHNIHDTVSTGGSYSLYLLVALQVAVVLILVILLGISGATLTRLNMVVEVCDNRGGSSTGASTSSQTNVSCATPNVSCNCSFTGHLTNSISQVGQTIGNQLGQMMNQMQNSSSKLDDLQMFATQQTTDTQNASARLNMVLQTTGDTASKFTTIASTLNTTTLNNIETTGVTTSSVANDILGIVDQLLELQIFNSIRPVSCQDIKTAQPNSPTGHYHVNSRNIYCNMDTLCNVTGGWTRIGYMDMSDAAQNCPSGFRYEVSGSVRTCGRTSNSPSCSPSLTFPTNGLSYTKICGRVRGYQRGSTDAITPDSQHNILNSYYVDGISITRGSPREHIWSFIAGVFSIRQGNDNNCPCTTGSNQANNIQSFVGNDYYCESGNPNNDWSKTLYPDDPLWDGQQCISLEAGCCTNPYLPWFYRDFGNVSSTEGLELRVCGDEGWDNEDSPFGLYEFYIQ